MTQLDCPFIPGRIYRTRDPELIFQAWEIEPKSGLIFGCKFRSIGGYVGPATRLPDGRVSADKESPGVTWLWRVPPPSD